MKYLDEYRNEVLAQKVVSEIRRVVTKPWVLMEVCGGQTHTIVNYGIDHLIPSEVEVGGCRQGESSSNWLKKPTVCPYSKATKGNIPSN